MKYGRRTDNNDGGGGNMSGGLTTLVTLDTACSLLGGGIPSQNSGYKITGLGLGLGLRLGLGLGSDLVGEKELSGASGSGGAEWSGVEE